MPDDTLPVQVQPLRYQITRDQIKAAFVQWHDDHRNGLCMLEDAYNALQVDEAAELCASYFIDLLTVRVASPAPTPEGTTGRVACG